MKLQLYLLSCLCLLLAACHDNGPEQRFEGGNSMERPTDGDGENNRPSVPPVSEAEIFASILSNPQIMGDGCQRYEGPGLKLRVDRPGVMLTYGYSASDSILLADIDGNARISWLEGTYSPIDSMLIGSTLRVNGRVVDIKAAKRIAVNADASLTAVIDKADSIHILRLPLLPDFP